MARANECRQWLPLWCDQRLFKSDPLIARQHWFPHADEPVTVADRGRNVGHLIAARLPLANRPTELRKGFQKERLNIVRLEATRLSTFHVFTYTGHATGIHRVMGEGALFE